MGGDGCISPSPRMARLPGAVTDQARCRTVICSSGRRSGRNTKSLGVKRLVSPRRRLLVRDGREPPQIRTLRSNCPVGGSVQSRPIPDREGGRVAYRRFRQLREAVNIDHRPLHTCRVGPGTCDSSQPRRVMRSALRPDEKGSRCGVIETRTTRQPSDCRARGWRVMVGRRTLLARVSRGRLSSDGFRPRTGTHQRRCR